MKKHITYIILLVVSLTPTISFSQKTTIWTLDACIAQAQEKNMGVKQAQIGLLSAESNFKTSKQAFLPNLNFSTALNWNFGKSIDPTTNSFITQNFLSNNGGFFSDVTLYNGGATRNELKSNKYKMLSREASLEQQKRDIALQVALTYLQILYQKDQIIIAENQLNLGILQKKRIAKLIEVGNLPQSDIFELEAQIANNEQLVLMSQNNHKKSKLILQQLLHIDDSYGEGFEIESPTLDIPVIKNDGIISNAELLKISIKNEPNIAAKRWQIKSSESQIKVAKSSYLPSLKMSGNLGAGYSELAKLPNISLEWQNRAPTRINGIEQNVEFLSPVINGYDNIAYLDQLNQNIRYGASLSLSVPIYNRGQISNRVQQAKLQNETAELALETAIYQLKTAVSNAVFDYNSSSKIWEAKTKTLNAKKKSYVQSKKKFELGSISIYEYTVAKSFFENAQQEVLNAKYDLLFKGKILDYYRGNKL